MKELKNLTANNNLLLTFINNKTVHLFTVFCLPILLYVQTLGFDLTYADDDDILINNYAFLSNINNAPHAFLKDAFLENSTPLYRPLQTLSYMADIWLSGGNNNWMFHLTNLLLIGLAACLLLLLLKKFSVPLPLALLGTLIYFTHPLFVSTVAWIPARGDLLLTVFSLASFLFFIEYLRNGKIIYLILNWVFYTAALFSKETAALLPLIFLVFYFSSSIQIPHKRIIIVFTVLAYLTSGIFWFWLHSIAVGNTLSGNHVGLMPFISNLRTIPESLASFFLPVNIELIPSFSMFKTLTGLIIIVFIFLIYMKLENSGKQIFWPLWFLLLLLPTMFYKTDYIDYLNHRFFLPLIGILFFTVLSIPKKWLEEKLSKISFLFVVIISYQSYLTFSKSQSYSDPLTYSNACISENPNNSLMYNNRGFVKAEIGDFQGAIADYSKALELNPIFALIFYNRGNVYSTSGDFSKAISDYSKAIELNPENLNAYYNRANANQAKGNLSEAINDYNKVIELNPDYLFAYNNRGLAYNNQGYHELAIKDFNKVLEIDPTYSIAYSNRGLAYSSLGKSELAIKNYTRAIELDPNFADAYYNRAIEFKNLGMIEEAGKDFKKYEYLRNSYKFRN